MHQFQAMNTTIVTLGLTESAEKDTEQWFDLIEQNLSRFREDSELSKLNRSGGRPFLASPLLYQVLSEAYQYFVRTDGLFNPFLGKQLQAAGYAASFEQVGTRSPGKITAQAAKSAAQHVPLQFKPGMQSIVLARQTSVDLGGFAKGWCAQELSMRLRKEGISTGAIGAGGDIAFWGSPEACWEVGIADPHDNQTDILSLQLQGTIGIATSSTAKRRWYDTTGQIHHHILDPRTGLSVESDLLQVTVLAPSLIEAEVYAKCVLILGADAGLEWLANNHPDCAAVGICQDGSVRRGGSLSLYTVKGGTQHESIS